MAEKRKLEFYLLRYVPDAVKGEFVNFGLVAVADGTNGTEVVDVRFTKDRSRIFCLDPSVDTEMLDRLQGLIREEIGVSRDKAILLRRMEDSFSGVVQISGMLAVLTSKTIAEEIEEVARTFLERPKAQRVREPAGRGAILDTMRSEFEKAGVLDLLVPVPVESYTKPGDPFSFDFGYRTGNEMKLFHAVSMRASVEAAVMLAARYPKIATEMARVAQAAPVLRAVIEDGLNEQENTIRFALEMMREAEIKISRAKEMPEIAGEVRSELRA